MCDRSAFNKTLRFVTLHVTRNIHIPGMDGGMDGYEPGLKEKGTAGRDHAKCWPPASGKPPSRAKVEKRKTSGSGIHVGPGAGWRTRGSLHGCELVVNNA